MSAPVSPAELQQVWMHRGDLERLEKAAECAMRASDVELATSLWAIILRVRTETGWEHLPSGYTVRWDSDGNSNVVPIR